MRIFGEVNRSVQVGRIFVGELELWGVGKMLVIPMATREFAGRLRTSKAMCLSFVLDHLMLGAHVAGGRGRLERNERPGWRSRKRDQRTNEIGLKYSSTAQGPKLDVIERFGTGGKQGRPIVSATGSEEPIRSQTVPARALHHPTFPPR